MGDGPAADRVGTDPTTRTGLVAALVVAAVVLVALVAVVLQRDPPPPDLATPQGTVQAWLQSVADGEPDQAMLDPATACGDDSGVVVGDDDVRAVLVDTTRDGQRATVVVTITESAGGVFDQGFSHDERYRLRRVDRGWVISAYGWPWDHCWNDAVDHTVDEGH